MKPSINIFALASVIALASGCATLDMLNPNKSAVQTEAAKPAPVVNPFAAFEQARSDESLLAEQTRLDILALLKNSKDAQKLSVEPVQYVETDVTDRKSQQSRRFRVVSSLALMMPLSLKNHPSYDQAIAKIKALAEKLADDRGAADIMFFFNAAEAKTLKIQFGSAVADSPRGKPITVTKAADAQVQKGLQRLVIKAGALQNRLI